MNLRESVVLVGQNDVSYLLVTSGVSADNLAGVSQQKVHDRYPDALHKVGDFVLVETSQTRKKVVLDVGQEVYWGSDVDDNRHAYELRHSPRRDQRYRGSNVVAGS